MRSCSPWRFAQLLLAGAIALPAAFVSAAQAHELTIEVEIEPQVVVVQVRYDNGSIPAVARVRISDGSGATLDTVETDRTGSVEILRDLSATGLVIEATDEDDHHTYFVLTPADLE